MQHVLTRIATTSAEGTRSQTVSDSRSDDACAAAGYIELLARLIARFTQQVTPYESRLKEAFDYLTYLRPAAGLALLAAVLPLLPLSKGFQDHMMIVLRKTMFRGDLQSRLTAVGGFGR